MRAKALLYHLGEETETGKALCGVLTEQHILALRVDETQLGETVGRLVSTNAAPVDACAPEGAPEAPFLLLCALGDRQLDRLLASMRRVGVSVPYKAVVTDANKDWMLCKLMTEVAREHEAMKNSR